MIQCSECEHYHQGPEGRVTFRCDPFSNIKEPECLVKWQLLRTAELASKLNRIVAAQEAQAAMYKRMAPLQEKMFRHIEREIDAADESDSWREGYDDEDTDEDEGERGR